MVRTARGFKSKQSQRIGQQIKKTSSARVRSEIDFLTLKELEKGQSHELGKVLHHNIRGSNKTKKQVINVIDNEVMLAFKGKENNLHSFLTNPKLPKAQRVVLVAYASTYISRMLDKAVRNKFGQINRSSKPVELSTFQVNDMVRLLSGISGLNKSQLRQLVRTRVVNAKSLDTKQHFQLSAISVLSKYVFSVNPQLSSNEFISHFLSTLNKSKSYDSFYESLNDKSLPQNKRLLRLLGMTGNSKSKALIYSTKIKPATIIHELVHDVLSTSGKKALFWSEPFVTMVSNILAERSGFDLGYLNPSLRKSFSKSPMYAIANFPWRNISSKDIARLSRQIESIVESNPNLKNARYSEFNNLAVNHFMPIFFSLLERKLPNYSKEDKKIVREIAKQGIIDCEKQGSLNKTKKMLEQIMFLTF